MNRRSMSGPKVHTVLMTRDIPVLALRAGDVVIVDPGHPGPLLALWRPLAINPCQLLALLEEGAGELSPELSFGQFAAVLQQTAGSRRLALVP